MERSVTRDPLTRLPSRRRLVDEIGRARGRGTLAVIDLDDFGRLNDTLGYEQANALLRLVGARLVAAVDRNVVVSRLAADSFGVLYPEEVGDQVVEGLQDDLRRPYAVGGDELHLTASIGYTTWNGARDPESALLHAHMALRAARSDGTSRTRRYTESLGAAASRRHQLLADLEGADDRGELHLLYQPVVDLQTRRVVGAEALMRWDHPRLVASDPTSSSPSPSRAGSSWAWASGPCAPPWPSSPGGSTSPTPTPRSRWRSTPRGRSSPASATSRRWPPSSPPPAWRPGTSSSR